MVWQPNEELPVMDRLPDDEGWSLSSSPVSHVWRKKPGGGLEEYHRCVSCGGWIAGHPIRHEYGRSLSPGLNARIGTAYFCRRCGLELAFFGVES